jgi:hypothetical protein
MVPAVTEVWWPQPARSLRPSDSGGDPDARAGTTASACGHRAASARHGERRQLSFCQKPGEAHPPGALPPHPTEPAVAHPPGALFIIVAGASGDLPGREW